MAREELGQSKDGRLTAERIIEAWEKLPAWKRWLLRRTDRHIEAAVREARARLVVFACPRCERTSYHPDDRRYGYCGRCRWWTGDPILGSPEVIAQAELEGAIEPVR